MFRANPTPHLRQSGIGRAGGGRLGRFFFLSMAAGMILTGCGRKQTTAGPGVTVSWHTHDWPMTRGGGSLQGRVHDRVPHKVAIAWTFAVKGAITSEAAIADGVAVFGDDQGWVHAVDLSGKKELWRVETKDNVEATPAIASGRVFVGSNDDFFRALDFKTGRELWQVKGEEKFPTGAVVIASPDGKEEWVLVNGYDGVTRCLRTRDGSEVWKHETTDYINGTPVILDNGTVAFGGCDAVIHVIGLKDGVELHQQKTSAQVIRSLAAWEGTVYAVDYANELLATGTSDDKSVWVYDNGDNQFLTSPAVDEKRVYVGSRDKHLHAVDRLTGKPLWKFRTGGRVESSPLVFDDAVVFGSGDGRLYAVSKEDGQEIWRLDLGEGLPNAAAFADGRIVIGGVDGTLFVIREEEGK